MRSITEVVPTISTATKEELRLLDESSETHSVPFGGIRVEAFKDEVLRECIAQYYDADYADPRLKFRDTKVDRRSSALWQLLYNVSPRGLRRPWQRGGDFSELKVGVRILITYPLADVWETTVEIPVDRFGSVFSIAHDMYRHVYELDNAEWQKQGHQDKAPRAAPKVLNRAKGKYVWGHDIEDLVFEWLSFTPNPDWPTIERRKQIIVETEEELMEKRDPEFETVLEPISLHKYKGHAPFLGTITFFIGS